MYKSVIVVQSDNSGHDCFSLFLTLAVRCTPIIFFVCSIIIAVSMNVFSPFRYIIITTGESAYLLTSRQ